MSDPQRDPVRASGAPATTPDLAGASARRGTAFAAPGLPA